MLYPYGEDAEFPVDQWVLPAGSLRTACAALGLDEETAFTVLFERRPPRRWINRAPRFAERLVFGLRYRSRRRAVHCDRPTAEFTSAGLAVAGQLAGSTRPVAQMILEQHIRRANARSETPLGDCLEHPWMWLLNIQRCLVGMLERTVADPSSRERAAAIAVINEVAGWLLAHPAPVELKPIRIPPPGV